MGIPIWIWVLIGVIALVIIIAVIVAGRNGKPVEAPRPEPLTSDSLAPETPLAPRRGLDPEPIIDDVAPRPDPVPSPGRRLADEEAELGESEEATLDSVAESLESVQEEAPQDLGQDLDEDTLHAPLTIPDDVVPAHAEPDAQTEPAAPAVEEPVLVEPTVSEPEAPITGAPGAEPEPEPPVEDFAAEAPSDEPVGTDDSSAAGTHAEDSDLEQLGDHEDLVVEREATETVELGEDQGDIEPPLAAEDDVPRDESGRRLDPYGNPVDELAEDAPQYADRGDYGDVLPDDDIPRDDMGRRLDPYGNPIDEGPNLPPVPPIRP